MENEWEHLDTEALRNLYQQKQRELTESLLSGALWQDVRDQRKQVTELSIALYRRTQGGNPAEHRTRNVASKSER